MSALIEIEALLGRYFDALHRSDAALLGQVMHERAIYASADETPLLYRTMEAYLPIVAARPSPASRGEPRRDIVESIDLAGANTALARVRCSIGPRDFVDFLTLIREGAEWRIIAKIFQIIPTERTG
jgi:hypothetical protein